VKTTGLALLAALLLLPAAAGAADAAFPEKAGGGCRLNALACADYDKSIADEARKVCRQYKFEWVEAGCAKKGVVGTCVKQEGAGKSYSHTYPPGSAESAQKACDNTPGGKLVK